jgi:DNA-directed RNA polymerase subunit RPC12/RpoP
MPFLMPCPNKGCGDQMEPYLDPSDNKVYCSSCDKEISNVTHFVKIQMKSLKQYRKKKSLSFLVKCQKCSKEDRPKIVKDKIVCPNCNEDHSHLSEPFKIMLKEQLKKVNQDV